MRDKIKQMPKNTFILALDASMRRSSVAVAHEGSILAFRQDDDDGRGQAERLLPLIMAVMDDAGLGFESLGLVAATVGPGSFTGLRVGLAAAHGIALAAGIPVRGVSTFDALFYAANEKTAAGTPVAVAINSRRGDLFFRLYHDGKGGDMLSLPPAEAAALCPKGPLALCGDGASMLAQALIPGEGLVALEDIAVPDARIVARMAASGLAALPGSPLYLRPPDVTLPS